MMRKITARRRKFIFSLPHLRRLKLGRIMTSFKKLLKEKDIVPSATEKISRKIHVQKERKISKVKSAKSWKVEKFGTIMMVR